MRLKCGESGRLQAEKPVAGSQRLEVGCRRSASAERRRVVAATKDRRSGAGGLSRNAAEVAGGKPEIWVRGGKTLESSDRKTRAACFFQELIHFAARFLDCAQKEQPVGCFFHPLGTAAAMPPLDLMKSSTAPGAERTRRSTPGLGVLRLVEQVVFKVFQAMNFENFYSILHRVAIGRRAVGVGTRADT